MRGTQYFGLPCAYKSIEEIEKKKKKKKKKKQKKKKKKKKKNCVLRKTKFMVYTVS